MTLATSDLIHPTAVIDPEAMLAADVQVGPYAIIDGPVEVGPECVIEAHASLTGPMVMARRTLSATAPFWARARNTAPIAASRRISRSVTETSSGNT